VFPLHQFLKDSQQIDTGEQIAPTNLLIITSFLHGNIKVTTQSHLSVPASPQTSPSSVSSGDGQSKQPGKSRAGILKQH
jgi:hypothetical protein